MLFGCGDGSRTTLFSGYEPDVKPFHSSAIIKQGTLLRCSIQLSYLGEPKVGFEPTTYGLQAINELLLVPFK